MVWTKHRVGDLFSWNPHALNHVKRSRVGRRECIIMAWHGMAWSETLNLVKWNSGRIIQWLRYWRVYWWTHRKDHSSEDSSPCRQRRLLLPPVSFDGGQPANPIKMKKRIPSRFLVLLHSFIWSHTKPTFLWWMA